ncbi:mitochondrial inner membrane protein required for protein import [Arachnomyces sp. PD_36]|nr:mitochondrial inner membrane protein required for protein import [Arachnomyces sp. PD_36]
MLSRAALSLTRHRAIPSPTRLSHANQSLRWSVQSSQSNRIARHISPFSTRQPLLDKQSGSKPPAKEYSEKQVEFESDPKSQDNTAPQSSGAGAGKTEAARDKDGASSDFSKDQAEFETAATGESGQQQPLPDLTQGIPSTLAAELNEARSKKHGGSAGLNLTEAGPETAGEGEGGGEGPKNPYVSSLERRRNRMANLTYAAMLGFAFSGAVYLGRNWDTEEEERQHPDAPSGWGFGLFYNRATARMSDLTSYYKDPPFPKLLPEEDPAIRQPYTLVISLEDLLVHSDWTREHGWRVAKRPGVDYFLRYLNQYYELVLFTSVPSMMADQVLRKLDPYRIIRWPLFREATRYKDGEYIKDLSYLNRDLSKVVLIDTQAAHAKYQPENAIILDKWQGDPKDKSLVALIPFLEYMAGMGIEDVRPVLKTFEGTYIPEEFARREKAMREKFEKQLAEERAKRPKHGVSSFSALLGIKPQSPMTDMMEQNPAEAMDQGKMLWDQIRERGQKQYEMIDKEIRENGEKWLAEMAAEEEKLKEEQMKGMKNSFTGFFGGGGESK